MAAKHLNTLGKQATKRTVKALTNKGIQAATCEVKKATSYYIKNSATLLKTGISLGVIVPSLSAAGMNSSYYYYKRYVR